MNEDICVKLESENGVRVSAKVLSPILSKASDSSKEVAETGIPLGLLYTPLKTLSKSQVTDHPEVTCKKCGAFMNQHCTVNQDSRKWICLFCSCQSKFEDKVNVKNLQCLKFSTIEYNKHTESQSSKEKVYIYVIDTILDRKEMFALQSSVNKSIKHLPSNCIIGLIVFGECIEFFCLDDGNKESYNVEGREELNCKELKKQLSLPTKCRKNKFLQKLHTCKSVFTRFINSIRCKNLRKNRCTGSALLAASSLIRLSGISNARVMMFVGGPCTYGHGTLFSQDKLIEDPQALKKKVQFYDITGSKCAEYGITVDFFSNSPNFVGLPLFSQLCNVTNGQFSIQQSFKSSSFQKSFENMLKKNQESDSLLFFNGKLTVRTSKGLKIIHLNGPCKSLNVITERKPEDEIDASLTFPSLTKSTTVALFCNSIHVDVQTSFIQLVINFENSKGELKTRATTIKLDWLTKNENISLEHFDLEAAAVLTARLAVEKCRKQSRLEVMKWLDNMIINFGMYFGKTKTENGQEEYNISKEMFSYIIQLFFLRKSPLIHEFENSYLTYFYINNLERENIENSLAMILPKLYSFSNDLKIEEFFLYDRLSLPADGVTMINTFSHVIIYLGKNLDNSEALGNRVKEKIERELIKRVPFPQITIINEGKEESNFVLSFLDYDRKIEDKKKEHILPVNVSPKVFIQKLVSCMTQRSKNFRLMNRSRKRPYSSF